MRVTCVVQARTGSTRLPGKVLQPIDGRPMLRFMLDRLATVDVDTLVVATSTLARDDAVADIARDAGYLVVRGSETDVLGRFVTALDAAPADHVVRLTADCPLIDPKLVEAVVARHFECDADYTSNVFPRTFPKGLDAEVVRAPVLRTACAEATDAGEREHVTPFVYRRPERFRLANLRNDQWLGGERWTVDTADDLEFVRELVNRIGDSTFSWRDAYKIVGAQQRVARGEMLLVPAAMEHRTFVLACRSDSDAVRWSRTGRAVGAEEHAQWYEATLADPAVRFRVAILDDEPIGTVRVDVVGGVGEVGIALLPGRRGEGLSARLLDALLADCGADPQVVSLVATIHPDNVASIRAFAGAGFARGSDRDGFRVLHRPVHQPI